MPDTSSRVLGMAQPGCGIQQQWSLCYIAISQDRMESTGRMTGLCEWDVYEYGGYLQTNDKIELQPIHNCSLTSFSMLNTLGVFTWPAIFLQDACLQYQYIWLRDLSDITLQAGGVGLTVPRHSADS